MKENTQAQKGYRLVEIKEGEILDIGGLLLVKQGESHFELELNGSLNKQLNLLDARLHQLEQATKLLIAALSQNEKHDIPVEPLILQDINEEYRSGRVGLQEMEAILYFHDVEGKSVYDIARLINRNHGTIYHIVNRNTGLSKEASPARQKDALAFVEGLGL